VFAFDPRAAVDAPSFQDRKPGFRA
jgi:hypothetical protein